MVADDPRFPPPGYLPGERRMRKGKTKILAVIELLSEINAGDLDNLSVAELAQLYFWLTKHQGSIFVESVGRLGIRIEGVDE